MNGILGIFSPDDVVKDQFLKFIENDKRSKIDLGKGGEMSYTSYQIDSYDESLVELYSKHLDSYVGTYVKNNYLNCIWYQIYEARSGSFHGYHTHDAIDCQVSGIYYLKLPDTSVSTEFMIDNTPRQLDVKEGDVVLFDSRIEHRSPPNHSPYDKIILSFNLYCGSDFVFYNEDR